MPVHSGNPQTQGHNGRIVTRFRNLPNVITMGRLFLVPLIVAMVTGERWVTAFTLFVVAGISDALDGWLAKRFSLQSELGAYLDPIADKTLLMAIYVALGIAGAIPPWLAILVVSRDIMIVGAVILAWLLDRPVGIRPLFISKVNTTVQIGFAAAMLATKAFGFDPGAAQDVAVVVVAALTLASAGAYLGPWIKHVGL
jgi:cardiolipin synthase